MPIIGFGKCKWRTEENDADPFDVRRLRPKVPDFGGHRNQQVAGRVPTHFPSGFGPGRRLSPPCSAPHDPPSYVIR